MFTLLIQSEFWDISQKYLGYKFYSSYCKELQIYRHIYTSNIIETNIETATRKTSPLMWFQIL